MQDKINFEKFSIISVDCIIGVGPNCQSAAALKRNSLRLFSSPFDWIMKYDLDTVIQLLKSKGEKFFSNCYEDKSRTCGHNRCMIDKETGIISIHDFPNTLPVTEAPKYYYDKYNYKFEKLDEILKKAQTICLISNRQIDTNTIKAFIYKFKKMYHFKHMYFINIYDTCDAKKELCKTTDYENVSILEFYFNDEHINGRNAQKNSDYWYGNIDYWDKILHKIHLNNTCFSIPEKE